MQGEEVGRFTAREALRPPSTSMGVIVATAREALRNDAPDMLCIVELSTHDATDGGISAVHAEEGVVEEEEVEDEDGASNAEESITFMACGSNEAAKDNRCCCLPFPLPMQLSLT